MITAETCTVPSRRGGLERRAPAPATRRRPRGRYALVAVALLAVSGISYAAAFGGLSAHGAITLTVFLAAVLMWIATPIDDAYVALAAASALVVTGSLSRVDFTGALGEEFIWLLIGAFVIAAAVTATGLPARIASRLVTLAHTPRQLVHLMTVALIITAFAIPSTSGRAALALPVFLGLATALPDRKRLVRCLAVLTPTVILLSAIASPLGAGAHLLTIQILDESVGASISFMHWLVLGVPLALVWSHLAAEIILRLFTRPEDRLNRFVVQPTTLASDRSTAPGTPLSRPQCRVLAVVAVVIAAWCTEPIHSIGPAVVAVIGALITVAPGFGTTSLSNALKTVPWSLLMFMAATLALATALTKSGAAEWLAASVFSPRRLLDDWATVIFVVVLIIVSIGAHLVLQSRSARTAALIPVVVVIAPTAGIDPVAAAFMSTAAAGFCLTLTSSAKPLALFAAPEDVPGYSNRDLMRMSAVLAPISAVLLTIFAFAIWPTLGLTLSLA